MKGVNWWVSKIFLVILFFMGGGARLLIHFESNRFGCETASRFPHGLWTTTMNALLDFVQKNGFNTLRIPFSLQFGLNPDGPVGDGMSDSTLAGLNRVGVNMARRPPQPPYPPPPPRALPFLAVVFCSACWTGRVDRSLNVQGLSADF
jgi:hypothetical protein